MGDPYTCIDCGEPLRNPVTNTDKCWATFWDDSLDLNESAEFYCSRCSVHREWDRERKAIPADMDVNISEYEDRLYITLKIYNDFPIGIPLYPTIEEGVFGTLRVQEDDSDDVLLESIFEFDEDSPLKMGPFTTNKRDFSWEFNSSVASSSMGYNSIEVNKPYRGGNLTISFTPFVYTPLDCFYMKNQYTQLIDDLSSQIVSQKI